MAPLGKTGPFSARAASRRSRIAYVVAACLTTYFDDSGAALARYDDIRRERTSAVVRKSHTNRGQAERRDFCLLRRVLGMPRSMRQNFQVQNLKSPS